MAGKRKFKRIKMPKPENGKIEIKEDANLRTKSNEKISRIVQSVPYGYKKKDFKNFPASMQIKSVIKEEE